MPVFLGSGVAGWLMGIFDRFRLDGQVAVITGAGKGIGAGIALAYAEAGADVFICARTESEVAAAKDEIVEATWAAG